jgi:mannosyltransferase OCH1-like enzyme
MRFFHTEHRVLQVVAVKTVDEVVPLNPIQGPIPHILWFTYKHNILETQQPKVFYDNIMKTIEAYRSEWKESNATVNFLLDENCTQLLREVDKRENTALAQAFQEEPRGDFKADLCRLAALFLHGGYYFDVDLEVVKPLQLDPLISFSTARDAGASFFQAFLAATPGHPLLRANLKTMMEYYVEKRGRCYVRKTQLVGPCTLKMAWDRVSRLGHVRLLQETHLVRHGLYPNMTQRGKGDACHWVVHDPEEMQVYFYSRVMGCISCGFEEIPGALIAST